MKLENEITVLVDLTLDELDSKLRKYDFKIIKEYDIKDIYMLDKKYKNNQNDLELLKHCILIRNEIDNDKNIKLIEYKHKEYNKKGEIVKNKKIYCKVDCIKNVKALLEAIGYEELIRINDHLLIYSNGIDEFFVQFINNKHVYIEIEQNCEHTTKKYKKVDEMKEVISKYKIPIKNNDYYVKKVLIELMEK